MLQMRMYTSETLCYNQCFNGDTAIDTASAQVAFQNAYVWSVVAVANVLARLLPEDNSLRNSTWLDVGLGAKRNKHA